MKKNDILLFALYDSRAAFNKERAICYSVCETLNQAKREKREDFPDAVIFKETVQRNGKEAIIIKSERVL